MEKSLLSGTKSCNTIAVTAYIPQEEYPERILEEKFPRSELQQECSEIPSQEECTGRMMQNDHPEENRPISCNQQRNDHGREKGDSESQGKCTTLGWQRRDDVQEGSLNKEWQEGETPTKRSGRDRPITGGSSATTSQGLEGDQETGERTVEVQPNNQNPRLGVEVGRDAMYRSAEAMDRAIECPVYGLSKCRLQVSEECLLTAVRRETLPAGERLRKMTLQGQEWRRHVEAQHEQSSVNSPSCDEKTEGGLSQPKTQADYGTGEGTIWSVQLVFKLKINGTSCSTKLGSATMPRMLQGSCTNDDALGGSISAVHAFMLRWGLCTRRIRVTSISNLGYTTRGCLYQNHVLRHWDWSKRCIAVVMFVIKPLDGKMGNVLISIVLTDVWSDCSISFSAGSDVKGTGLAVHWEQTDA